MVIWGGDGIGDASSGVVVVKKVSGSVAKSGIREQIGKLFRHNDDDLETMIWVFGMFFRLVTLAEISSE